MYLSFIEKASLGLGFSMKRIVPFDSSILHGNRKTTQKYQEGN
jgi:hypothetical protein